MCFLKVILKRVSFVMALFSIRTRTKCYLLKIFQMEVLVYKMFFFVVSKRVTRSESTYSTGLKRSFPSPLDVAILPLFW